MSDYNDALNQSAALIVGVRGKTATFRGVTIPVSLANFRHAREMFQAGHREAVDGAEFRTAAMNVAGLGDPKAGEDITYNGVTYVIGAVVPAGDFAWVLICNRIDR